MSDSKLFVGAGVGVGAVLLAKWLDSQYFISRDLSVVLKLLPLKAQINKHIAANATLADIWEESATKWAKKPSIVFEGKVWTFGDIENAANQYAAWLQSIGIKQGDIVALFMENKPEYLVTWLAVAKLGGVTALINYNVKGKPLVHCLTVSGAKTVIFGSEVAEPIQAISDELKQKGFAMYSQGGAVSFAQHLDPLVINFPAKRLSKKLRMGRKFMDPALLVYTSGTTGLPKAATITHLRFWTAGQGFVKFFEVRHDDRIYTVLPLYHSAGGMCGIGMMMNSGATMILRRKFSAKGFWDDCRESKATVVQYIGELCRYLLLAPPQPNDNVNQVRICIGNGLRPDIWKDFQKRFAIREIGEFYGSTEGNATLFNHCRTPEAQGAVGAAGPLLSLATGLKVVKFDVVAEEPIRTAAGFCTECKAGETGELLGEIKASDPVRQFSGYHGNESATKKKILENVFKKGDKYFRTGDLLKRDTQGYWYFMDRIGDTFRWKGENVSTTEVAEVLSTFPGVEEVNVYGVSVPGFDGRACMAACVLRDDLDLKALAKHAQANLPAYAVPLFLRKLPQIDITGTFKHQKVELRNQGCDPTLIKDPLWMFDGTNKTYAPLTLDVWQTVAAGRAKL